MYVVGADASASPPGPAGRPGAASAVLPTDPIYSLLQHILDARPEPIDLTAAELDLLSAYLATLSPLPPAQSVVLGAFSAEAARNWPASTPDLAGTERLRRQHLEYVRRVNERRLAALSSATAPVREPAPPSKSRRMSAATANELAFKLLRHRPAMKGATLRELADAVGCSPGTLAKTPMWVELMKQTDRGKFGRTPQPKVIGYTPGVEATVGNHDAELQRLIYEQAADAEPSPLDDDPPADRPRIVRSRKRL